jgi:hypothetical protein
LCRKALLPLTARRDQPLRASRGAPLLPPHRQPGAKKTHSATTIAGVGSHHGGDSMRDFQADRSKPVHSIVPDDIPAMSDDECLARLAKAIQEHDSEHLDEVARLIARLAVTIE